MPIGLPLRPKRFELLTPRCSLALFQPTLECCAIRDLSTVPAPLPIPSSRGELLDRIENNGVRVVKQN